MRRPLLVVAGVELPGLWPSEYHFGGALLKKALFASLTTSFFIATLLKASFHRAPIKKPGSLIQAFLVDKVIEISNLELVTDLLKLVEYSNAIDQ